MAALPLNAVIGKYRIERLVGSGGMGEVYRATDLQARRQVAVKAVTHASAAPAALARFRNEAVIQYNLRHPNVAELYECFTYHGNPCIVMELIEGRTLRDWIWETGGLETAKALEILADVCDAVSYMHSKGTIHRDIKSENIRMNTQGRAKLLDFGIAIAKDTPALTRTGYSVGTPEKMAPEQYLGSRGDARSDVWSLGVLLYEMVTGVAPFASSSEEGLRQDILAARYAPPERRRPGLPKPLVRIISTCLRPKPADRYASSGVMLREVQQLRRRLDGPFLGRFRVAGPAYVALGLALLAVGLFVYAIGLTPRRSNSAGEPNREGAIGGATAAGRSAAEADGPARTTEGPPQGSAKPVRTAVPAGASVPPTPGRDAQGPAAKPDASAPELATVYVATYDGPAQVTNEEGQVLGNTRYPLTGPVGRTYELWLRRQGFQARKVEVQISLDKNEYTFGLEKN